MHEFLETEIIGSVKEIISFTILILGFLDSSFLSLFTGLHILRFLVNASDLCVDTRVLLQPPLIRETSFGTTRRLSG